MFDKMRHHFFWLHTAKNVCTTVKNCRSCTQVGSKAKHICKVKRFPGVTPFEFLAISILGRLPSSLLGMQHVDIMNDRYLRLTCSITTPNIKLMHLASIILDNWPLPYVVSTYVLTGDVQQNVSIFAMNIYIH